MATPSPAPSSLPNPLLDPRLLADPYSLYRMLRSGSPVLRLPIPGTEGAGVWLLTRYADVQSALKDHRFSVDRRRAQIVRDNWDRVPASLLGESGGLRTMLIMDPPDHTRVRGLVSKAFTPRHVARLRPRIEAIVSDLLDAVAGTGGMDAIADFAGPLPAIVIAELLGVPPEDHRRFKQWSNDLISRIGPSNPLEALQGAEQALRPLLDYLTQIIAARRRAPRDDLISAMIHAQEERDALTDAELLATSNLLLIAGHETTTNWIGNGLLALLRHPDQMERLRAEPALLESGTEELLRFDSPVQATVRVATEDVEIGGQTLPEGALVVCGIGAANRDPDVFPEPDRLDIARGGPQHLSFGFGAHFCLGAPLARLEAQLAFGALVARFPDLRLASDEIQWRPHPVLRGLVSLPVAF